MRGLRAKNVLVTGATSGIGQAVAVRFAEYGANVAINYLRAPDGAVPASRYVFKNRSVAVIGSLRLACRWFVD